MRIVFGLFIVAHGLVHLLYFALSRKFFELDPPLAGWPEGSWLFSNFFDVTGTRSVATVLYLLSTAIFVISGAGLLLQISWGNTAIVISAIVSSVVIFLFWDGGMQRLLDKGFLGILINVILIALVFLLERGMIAI